MFQFHYQSLRPMTTAHLAQTMSLLMLTAEELHQQIEAELAANPALELLEERRCPTCHRPLPSRGVCPVCSQPRPGQADEPVVFVSQREDFGGGDLRRVEDAPEDNYTVETEDLPTHVLRQVALDLAPEDRPLAAYLLTHLDDDGFLTTTLLEVARYFHTSLERVGRIQQMIQRADPVGVGSLTPQEALLVQLEVLAETQPVPELAAVVIREGMDLLSHRQYAELMRQLHIDQAELQQIVRFISENLNPYPARAHWEEGRQAPPEGGMVYHRPDIVIGYLNDDPANALSVEIIMPLHGTLRVNPLYRQVVQQADEEKREAWRGDLERAALFVKCLQQRNHTILRLMQRVAQLQRSFIVGGEKHLKSITRAQLAEELQVHESTVSRAVANKAVQLPNGRIVPLANFFDRNLNVRTVLCEIVARETHPLSDSELALLLAKEGFPVARRTVAKYRAMSGILPAHLRRPLTP